MSTVELQYSPSNSLIKTLLAGVLTSRSGFKESVGLPDIKVEWKNAKADKATLSKYCETLNLKQDSYLPILYPHVLAGPMHMQLLMHKSFPFSLMGALHLKNRITQYKAIKTDASLDIKCELAGYVLLDKGIEFEFKTFVHCGGQLVWESVSTFLKSGKYGKATEGVEKSFELTRLENAAEAGGWFVPKNRGKKYAHISRDYNPIHISATLAKFMGLKRDIAHGVGVWGEAIEQAKSIEQAGGLDKTLQVDVIFKGPMFLGSQASLKKEAGRFDVYCGSNPRPSICAEVKAI